MTRERLKILHFILTDRATYVMYNTQTIPDDAVNIEIERISKGSVKKVLEDELFDDSWGGLNGQSFHSLCQDAINRIKSYAALNSETIIQEL